MNGWTLGIFIAALFGFIIGALLLIIPIAVGYRIIKRRWPSKILMLCSGVIGGIIGIFVL